MDCCDNPMAMGRVFCPKPRRVVPPNTNKAVLPLRFHIRNDVIAFDSKPGVEFLEFIIREDGFEEEPCATVSSSPPFFIGSPPCRIGNPLVQDAHFRVEKLTTTVSSPSDSDLVPSAHSRVKLENKQAALRVEGFDSPSSGVVALV
ncbi:uncharacterized protein LOC105176170 [Sesamum indicum]|uniref:Uncharacterized protein LOC105176170 n=1 Tax=Sesamum indicum TaxID=4182 RepID=A0A6I9UFQ0_SESIN|nr:uncharacterized protein LOC105176170 [Sesamum indicum]